MTTLPPLPEGDTYVFAKMDRYYSDDQMTAYGQACYRAALEEVIFMAGQWGELGKHFIEEIEILK